MREVCLWRGYMKAGAALIDEVNRFTGISCCIRYCSIIATASKRR